jgi:membrane-bound lytic murein transglycosylase A
MSLKRLSLLASVSLFAVILAGCVTAPPGLPVTAPAPAPAPVVPPTTQKGETLRPVNFSALPGWDKDDQRESWPAFLTSCEVLIKKADWKEPCSIARDVNATDLQAVRHFFVSFFVPNQVFNADGSDTGLVTGYYEPLLRGARKRGGIYQTPLYRTPDDMLTIDLASVYPELKGMRLRGRIQGNKVVAYYPRADLAKAGALSGKELLWVDDPIEAFFLQVQGSGRVAFADGGPVVRLAYADQNGYPYKSIGRYLVDRGELTLDQASAQGIKAWYAAHPERQQELLNANPSFVFFKEESIADPRKGPKGALGVPLTPQRSIAVDTLFIPLGAPVYLSTTQPNNPAVLQRLMMAQDTGGAIKSAVRADYFWGFGAEAGEKAGKMKQRGTMWVLLPKLPANTAMVK